MLAEESKEMEQAAEKLMVISQDEEARARAMSRENSEYAMRLHERGIREDEQAKSKVEKEELEQEKDVLEQKVEKSEAEKDVLEQKVEKSEAEKEVLEQKVEKSEAEKEEMEQKAKAEKVESARSMVGDNLPVETIKRYTGLSVEEIKRLQGQ